MDDTADLLKVAEEEMHTINEELGLHSEKYAALQAKLAQHRAALHKNRSAVSDLQEALKIRKFMILIVAVVTVSGASFLAIKYLV